MAYSLSDKAVNVLQCRTLPEDEREAFNERIVEADKPGIYGIRLNLPELWKRAKGWLRLRETS